MLTFWEFRAEIVNLLPKGKVLRNPGGVKSVIASITENNIYYIRGSSKIGISFQNLYDAYKQFAGKKVSSTELKEWRPQVFSSKSGGHSCNCTFLFLVLREIGLVSRIEGRGQKGDPFKAMIKEDP